MAAALWMACNLLAFAPIQHRPVVPASHRHRAPSAQFTPATEFEVTNVRYAARDWLKTMSSLPKSVVLKRIRSPLRFNLAVTGVVCALHSYIKSNPLCWLATLLPSLPSVPHSLLGSALGLLLVFRTNAAYDRFYEARKQWGVVTSECRNLASCACIFMSASQALPLLSLVAAFPVVLKNYLRGERDTRRLKALLAENECDALASVKHQPLFVLGRMRMLAQQSAALGVTEKEREMLLKGCATLGDCVSTCERIYNTPIPLAYSRHTSRFLVLYTATLPLVLVGGIGWATMPTMLTICWALFGILEIGHMIEEPFTSSGSQGQPLLPLTEVCRTIRRDVRAIAQYATLASSHRLPVLSRAGTTPYLPESFKELKLLLQPPKANNTTSSANASVAAVK